MDPIQTPSPNYDFIMKSSQPGRNSFSSPSSPRKRLIIVIIGALLLITIFIVFLNLIRAPQRRMNAQFTDLAAYQTELVRVVSLGTTGTSADIRNTAQTAASSLQTDLNTTLDLMNRRGIKIDSKQLAKFHSTKTDTAFEEAKKANNFDQVYKATYEEKLADYQKQLKNVYDAQSGAPTRQALVDFNSHAVLLSFNYKPAQ